jgi:uncharacterized membrane protein
VRVTVRWAVVGLFVGAAAAFVFQVSVLRAIMALGVGAVLGAASACWRHADR